MIPGGRKGVDRRARSRGHLEEKLMSAVEALLEEDVTYSDLSLDEILERAGVPRSTFYYHFRDKGDLLVSVSADAMSEIVDASKRLYAGRWESRDDFTEVVADTARTWLAHVPLMNALSEVSAYDPVVRGQFLAGWGAAQAHLADYIRAGQAEGFVRDDLQPESAASWLTFMAERGLGLLAAEGPEAQDAVETLATIVWHALFPDGR